MNSELPLLSNRHDRFVLLGEKLIEVECREEQIASLSAFAVEGLLPRLRLTVEALSAGTPVPEVSLATRLS